MPGEKILVVDDEPSVREVFRMALSDEGYDVTSCDCGSSGLETLADNHFDMVIVDLFMPDMSGITMIMIIREMFPDRADMLVTISTAQSHIQPEDGEILADLNVAGYFAKPLDMTEFLTNVRLLLETRRKASK